MTMTIIKQTVTLAAVGLLGTALGTTAHADQTITLNGSTATGATIDNGLLTITEGGTYTLTGTGENIQVYIDKTVTEDVTLVLNNVTITNTDAAILSDSKTAHVNIVALDGTINKLSDSSSSSNKGAVQIKGSATINGNGTLTVNALGESAHAIKVSGSLDAVDVGLNLTSQYKNGIHTDDDVTLTNSIMLIDAKNGDGIQVENEDEVGKGNLTVKSGTYTITSGSDGMQATNELIVDGGNITINTDGEGLEARLVTINNGLVNITAGDDGINASDFTKSSSYTGNLVSGWTTKDIGITINGGAVNVVAAADGLDSNGFITINGGDTQVYSTGAADRTSSTLDHDGTATVNGGTALFASQYNGMIETFDGGSQAYISVNATGQKGSTITVTENGQTLDSFTALNGYSHVIYTSGQLTNSSSYSINGTSTTATNTRQGGQMGGPMGVMGG